MRAPALVLGLALLAGAAPAQDEVLEGRRLELRLRTTSDWTRVEFLPPAEALALDAPVVEGPAGARVGPTHVHKAAYDETPVELRCEILVSGLAPGGALEVAIERGDVGRATLVLARGEETLLEAIHDAKVPGDATNRRTWSVPAERVARVEPERIAPGPRIHPPLVLAFHYPWYGTPEGPSKAWVHWDPANARHASTHRPAHGWYDSHDPAVVRGQFEEAREAGLDGFVSSWWGPEDFTDRAFGLLLDEAARAGLVVAAYVETAETEESLARQLAYLVETYGAHPAWLRVAERPVAFVYARVVGQLGLAGIARVMAALRAEGRAPFAVGDSLDPAALTVFDGLHTYNPVFEDPDGLASTYRSVSWAARRRGALFGATVVPGYDDTSVRSPGGRRDRDGGRFYEASWDAAVRSNPDWILVTTWNEWHEGSEIEPSEEHGRAYLEATARRAREWKARAGVVPLWNRER